MYDIAPTPNRYCKQYNQAGIPIYLNVSDAGDTMDYAPWDRGKRKMMYSFSFCSNCGQSFTTHNRSCVFSDDLLYREETWDVEKAEIRRGNPRGWMVSGAPHPNDS